MYQVVNVMIESSGLLCSFSCNHLQLHIGQAVIVDTEKGLQYGIVKSEIYCCEDLDVSDSLKSVVRIATKEDEAKNRRNEQDRFKAFEDAKKLAEILNLNMTFVDAFFTFDRSQLLFHFVSEERVDFRDLAKRLAQIYHTRIELRQIGVRDRAKKIGGLGPCGRFLCCSSFLTTFASVSINMAKNQYISLNPTKINGVCGRLLCCLHYEDDLYKNLRKGIPDVGSTVETANGIGKVVSVDLLKGKYKVELKNKMIMEFMKEEGNNGKTS